MSFCNGSSGFPPSGIAPHMGIHRLGKPRIPQHVYLAAAGIIFLPFTTLFYVFSYIPGLGLTGWGWLFVIIGFLIDISAYGSSAYTNRSRFG